MLRATFAGFSTALSAMQANQKRLDITGQNLANMNTTGYTRQTLEASSLNYTNPVSKYMSANDLTVGFGVSMDRISQIRDPYLDAQYRTQMAKSSYQDGIQVALDSLADVLDESTIQGITNAFNDIQTTLTDMQDGPKGIDPVYESELRSRMQALTNLLNEAAGHIAKSEQAEYTRLDGEGHSENGAMQEVNDLLQQIGNLNVQIKRNQILGQPSLELMDERNQLLDTLSSFIPIEVSYFKDAEHTGTYTIPGVTDANGSLKQFDKMDELDQNYNVIGRKEWPDDLRVDMIYTKADGTTGRFTLVNGSEGGLGNNYGQMTVNGVIERDQDGKITNDKTAELFTDADSYGDLSDSITVTFTSPGSKAAGTVTIGADQGTDHFTKGSIQASLDMLEKTGDEGKGVNGIRGYEYYNNRLDELAKAFADVMNALNNQGNGVTSPPGGFEILNDRNGNDNITASSICIDPDWVSGAIGIGTHGDNPSDTIMNMLEAMKTTYPTSSPNLPNTIAGVNLENKTFANYMNNVSTILANDSLNNTTALKTNVTVLNGIQDSRDSVSGVSLDEEASNMMTYLSAYNAAARLMTTLDEALNTLINNTGLVGR